MSGGVLVPLELPHESVAAIVEEMENRGLVVPKDGRLEPYTVKEISEVSGLGSTTIERIIHAGLHLKKVPGSARLLVSAKSVREWLEGGCER